jgi:hypothetical protein
MKLPIGTSLFAVSLLAVSALAAAQTPPDVTIVRREAVDTRSDADRAKRDAEDAKVRAQLDKARAELDRQAQEVAELSMKLSGANDVVYRVGGPRQSMLGVQIDPESGKQGARVRSVSPGGPADEAGLRTGDVITTLDGKSIAGNERSGPVLIEQMRAVKPDQKVKVRVVRDGKNKDLVVVARPMVAFGPGERRFDVRGPEVGSVAMGGPMAAVMGDRPFVRQFRTFFRGDFDGLELASITPKLGAYFGATEGVLVVSAPEKESLKLEDGDVIQLIDGRKPTDGAHAFRILRSYKSDETLNLTVLRQHKPMTLTVKMPDRGEMDDNMFMTAPMPELPLMPGMPVPVPGGPGTFE